MIVDSKFHQGPVWFSNHFFPPVDWLARRKSISILAIFWLCFLGNELWALCRGIPIPYVQDEYSYLLAADTFAHGRITNPTHAMWRHFETFQVLQQPTYMSKYLPGEGGFLAIGQVVFGHPVYGVWLSSALMCAAICWMLYAWLPPRWALVGGVVAVLQFGVFTYWSQSYWGGPAVSGLGGALVFGALPRLFQMQRVRDSVWLGAGFVLMFISAPLEGFMTALPVGGLVLPWHIQWKKQTSFFKKIILPLGLILCLTVLAMGFYNKQITGRADVFPYLLYTDTNRNVPLFLWQPLTAQAKFDHPVMERFEKDYTERIYLEKRTWKGFLEAMQKDTSVLFIFFLGYPLAIPSLVFLGLFFLQRKTSARFWLALLILLATCAAMTCIARTRYFSALTCLAVLLVTIGLRGLGMLKLRKARIGLASVIFLMVLQLFLNIALTPMSPKVKSLAIAIQNPSVALPAKFTRDELEGLLTKHGGKYLVIVQYSSWHNYHYEWVYNGADIDRTPIVWARDMGPALNRQLLDYFKDRRVLFIYVFWDTHAPMLFDVRR
jgi:hypothetical protein